MHTTTEGLSVIRLSAKNTGAQKAGVRSNHYFIFIFEEATGEHTIGDLVHQLQNHSIHFVAQGLSQSFKGIKKMEGYCISFSPDLFSRYTLNKEILYDLPFFGYDIEKPCYNIQPTDFGFIYSLFNFAFTELRDKKTGHERIIISLINVVMLKCAQWFEPQNKKKVKEYYVSAYYGSQQLLENYRKLIRQHFREQHFVKFYAGQLGQTPNYLNMVVKSLTGLKASELIHQQIILEAKHLLIHTKLSHKEVAVELGFSDQSYFTKFFKRETGERPLDWFRKNK